MLGARAQVMAGGRRIRVPDPWLLRPRGRALSPLGTGLPKGALAPPGTASVRRGWDAGGLA